MAVVLSYWKHIIFIWRIGKFAHNIFNQIWKISTKIFGYIFNIKISGFIFSKTINIRNRKFKFQA